MKLILRADDLGISEGVNYGILKSIQDGVISCVGLMPNMESAKHGYQLIKDLDICLGQHTNICLGKPVCSPELIPSLVNENGEFYSSHDINHRQEDTIDILECELEIEANGVKIRNFFSHAGSKTIDPIIRIKCENNTIEWSFGRQWKIFDKSGRVIESAPIVEPHQRMFDSVVERIDNPDAFIYTLEAARNHTAVVEQMKAVAIQNVPPELILKREADGQLIADSVTKEITDRWQFAV